MIISQRILLLGSFFGQRWYTWRYNRDVTIPTRNRIDIHFIVSTYFHWTLSFPSRQCASGHTNSVTPCSITSYPERAFPMIRVIKVPSDSGTNLKCWLSWGHEKIAQELARSSDRINIKSSVFATDHCSCLLSCWLQTILLFWVHFSRIRIRTRLHILRAQTNLIRRSSDTYSFQSSLWWPANTCWRSTVNKLHYVVGQLTSKLYVPLTSHQVSKIEWQNLKWAEQLFIKATPCSFKPISIGLRSSLANFLFFKTRREIK